MKSVIILVIIGTLLAGCSAMQGLKRSVRVVEPEGLAHVDSMRFEKTTETIRETKRQTQIVTVRFEGVPLRQAMRILSDMTGTAIAWDSSIDEEPIIGTYLDQPLSTVLETIARRCRVSLSEVEGVFYLGEYRRQDMVTAVVRIPPIDREELTKALDGLATEHGKAAIVGSFVWLSDTFENVRKIMSDIEEIRKRSERSYLAEVYFIRVNEDDFVKLTGDLRINSIDVFSSAFNVEELFEMFVDADFGLGSASVDTRPVLFLSEGRKAMLQVGSEIIRERKAVNEKGVIETVGYDKFSDGIMLSLNLSRVSNDRYSVDMDLEVSTFDRNEKTTSIPSKDHSVLKSPGLLVRDGGIVYAGSLKRKDNAKIFGLFSLDASRTSDVLTIWVRVREIK